MASGFGVDRSADGTSGTSSSDIRKIFGGLYTPGIISGCTITTSGSTMSYTIAPGVVAIRPATGEIILAPVSQSTVVAPAAPASGTRTDILYVQQRYPSVEGDANLVFGVGTTLPARAVEVKRYIVSAGQTNTNAAVVTGDVAYSIPYGASLGVLHQYQDTGWEDLPNAQTVKGTGKIYVPTDRRVRFRLRSTLYAKGAVGFDNSKYVEYGFMPALDDVYFTTWTTPGLHQAWSTVLFEAYMTVPAGTHTVKYAAFRAGGSGTATQVYGNIGGFVREGTVFVVEDAGPVV